MARSRRMGSGNGGGSGRGALGLMGSAAYSFCSSWNVFAFSSGVFFTNSTQLPPFSQLPYRKFKNKHFFTILHYNKEGKKVQESAKKQAGKQADLLFTFYFQASLAATSGTATGSASFTRFACMWRTAQLRV